MKPFFRITLTAPVLLLIPLMAAPQPQSSDSTCAASSMVLADTAAGFAAPIEAVNTPAADSVTDSIVQHVTGDTTADSLERLSVSHAEHEADSLARAALLDSLAKARHAPFAAYSVYPRRCDSVFSIDALYPFQVFSSDANSIAEIFRFHPAMVPASFSLVSSLNRAMFFGIPSVPLSFNPAMGGIDVYPGAIAGADQISAARIHGASLNIPGVARYTSIAPSLVYPHMLMMWENGVFAEKSLDVRFARPLGRSLNIAGFSNYKYMERMDYSHKSGGMYDFYSGIIKDTSLIVRSGHNPLVRDHVSSARMEWLSHNAVAAGVSYTYMDLHDDIAFDAVIDTLPVIHWKERSLYSHRLSASVDNISAGIIGIGVQAWVKNDVNRIDPVNTTESVNDTITAEFRQRGENFGRGLYITPFLPIGRDTTTLKYGLSRHDQIRFDQTKWKQVSSDILLSHVHHQNAGSVELILAGAAGFKMVQIKDTLEPALVWDVNCWAKAAHQKIGIFARQDIQQPEIPYDTLPEVVPGSFLDRYRLYGIQGLLSANMAGLYIGAILTDDIDPYKAGYLWPRGRLPYSNPGKVLVAAPVFGRWHGLAASSSWMFSDTRPFVKSQSTLSYISPGRGGHQRLFVDAGFDYWSQRDPVELGGITNWHRSVYDMHCKIAVQVRTFRLYYKINNMFDRRYAYVPGYFLPGLTFRWGFNWFLQG